MLALNAVEPLQTKWRELFHMQYAKEQHQPIPVKDTNNNTNFSDLTMKRTSAATASGTSSRVTPMSQMSSSAETFEMRWLVIFPIRLDTRFWSTVRQNCMARDCSSSTT